jgi:branched-chain amino acid aminotransferase
MHKAPTVEFRGDFFISDGRVIDGKLFDETILAKGISLYEVVKIKERIPLFLDDHLIRLYYSAAVAGAKNLPTSSLVEGSIRLLARHNPDVEDGNIRILLHFPKSLDDMPSVFSWFIPHHYPTREDYLTGVPVILLQAERRFVHSKIIDLDFRSWISREIKNANANEALLTDSSGFITEGSKSNFFMIRNGEITTAPEADVLPGITRKKILEICSLSGIKIIEKKIHFSEIDKYDACFISGTSPGILAVRKIGTTGFSVNNPVMKQLSHKFNLLVEDYIKGNKQA